MNHRLERRKRELDYEEEFYDESLELYQYDHQEDNGPRKELQKEINETKLQVDNLDAFILKSHVILGIGHYDQLNSKNK